MSRRLFRKALNHIESRSCDSNISRLNNELKKTGMLSERMTTSTVLPATETQPFQAPTTSFVPDASGLTNTAPSQSFSAQPTYGGDVSDSSTWDTGWNSNAYLLNPNELDGETNRPLTYAPDKTPAGASGLVYGSFYYGTAIGYIDENNVFQTVLPGSLTGDYTGPNQTGLYYPEGSPQRENYNRQVSYWNAHLELVNRFGGNPTNKGFIHRDYTSYVNVWVMHTVHHHGPFENWTSSPKKPGFILRQAEVPTGIPARSKYTSDPGQPRTLVLNRLDDPSSPDYHEGFMNEYFRKNLNLSGQGLDHLLLASMAGEGVLPGVDDILLLGISGLVTLFGLSMQAAQSLYDYAMVMQSTNSMTVPLPGGNEKADSGYGPTVDNPTAKDLTPEQQAEVEAAGNELRDAQRALRDLEDNPDATDTQKDLAQERLDRASKNRQRLRKKHKEENKNRKESFNLNGGVLSEGWQSPDHTNVEKDSKTRWFNPNAGTDSAKWFDPKEVKPAYPAKAPPKMIDGYSADSNLAPKPVEKSPAIKLTKKDLLRNHKLKDSEILMMMQTISRLNKFIADHPEELIYARSRYPKHDPRLAELNWNMDQMLKASGDYLDKQFPENERLFTRIQNSIIKNIKATDPEEYKEVISTIETEKKARIIKKSHLSRKVSERERKSAFSRALKHLPTEARVQSDVTKERIEEIAKAELEYLKTIGKPKYYDWKDDGFDFSENFEDRKKSIQHFHSLIDKRIENLENALEEGMTTSEYIKQLYGEIPTITSIMSIDPNLLGSKFAQDVVQDSEKATTHAYGSHFPGSYVNSIGDFNPQSYSKVDAQAHLAHASANKAAAAPHDEDHVFAYQATDYVLPTAQQMTTNMTTVASGDFFSDQMKQMIWPTYGQVSPIPGPDPNEPGYNLDQYSYPWNHHIYPDNARFEALGYDMSNLTDEQQRTVIRDRVSFIGGKYGGVSGTYQDDNHFLDLTYGTARSIDETSFDIVNGGFPGMDDFNVYPEFESLGLGPGWGWKYQLKNPRYSDDHFLNADRDLTKEHWQYQENSEEFKPSHLEDIIGVTFPAVKVEKYNVGTSEEPEIEQWYSQPGGFHYDMEDGDLPGDNDVNWAGAYDECSAHKKIIQNARPGDVITFDYRIATDQWDNTAGYPLNGDDYGEGPYSGHSDELNELYVIAGKRIMKVWSLYRELPDDECTEDYGFVLRNTESPIDTGTFSYVIQESDINPITGALDFVTSYHADDFYVSRLSVTNFAIKEGKEFGSGKLGKTTAAYDLGAPVAALATDKGKKKKGEGDDEEEVFKSETTELSDEDKELQVKEKQRLDDIAAAEAAEEAAEQELADKAQEASVNLGGVSTWEGKIPTRYGIDIEDFTVNQGNPVTVPRGLFGDSKYVTSIEEYNTYQTAAGIPLFAFDSEDKYGEPINRGKDFWDQFTTTRQSKLPSGKVYTFERNEYTPFITHIQGFTTQYMRDNPEFGKERIEIMIKHPVYRADFLAKTSPEFRKWILGLDVEVGDQWLGKTYKPNLWPKGRSGFASTYGGWWIPEGDSHEDMVEAVKRAYYLFGPLNVDLSLDPEGPDPIMRLGDDPFPGKEEEDDEMNLITDLLKKAAEDPFSLTAEELRILKKYGYEDEVSEINELRKIVEDSGIDWSSILKALFDAANVALDVAAIIAILFPEPGSSAAGLARLIPRLRKLRGLLRRRVARGALNPFGQRTVRSGPAGRKRVDVYSGRPYQGKRKYGDTTYASTDPQTADTYTHPDLLRGLPGRGGRTNPRGTRDKGTLPQRYIDKYGSRSVYGQQQIKLGKKAARRTFGESFILENKQKNILSDIDNTIDIFIELLNKLPDDKVNETIQKFEKYAIDSNLDKNAYRDFSDNITRENNSEQIRKNKLKNKFISNNNLQKPNPNALYPGQPSPNGFPDTPPPNLAPNGYHPEYGKKADRYRKLDPVSAVMMRKVGTDDPQINKQVSDAARKPK